MAVLGVDERIVYEAKRYRTGLTNVVAFVTKSDLSVSGPYPLTEFSSTPFKGLYFFDLVTTLGQPEGEWMIVVYSPTENLRPSYKVRFELPESAIQSTVTILPDPKFDLDGVVFDASPMLSGIVISDDSLDGVVFFGDPAEIDGVVDSEDEIDGVTLQEEPDEIFGIVSTPGPDEIGGTVQP